MRRSVQTKLMDRLHRGFVYSCLGLTAYGSYLIAHRVYRFFTVIRPETRAYEKSLVEHAKKMDSQSSDSAPQLKA